MSALPRPCIPQRQVRAGAVLALCLTALFIQGEACALGTTTPQTPAADAVKPKPGEKQSDQAKAKPKAAGHQPAGTKNAAPHCDELTRVETFEPGKTYRLPVRRGYVSEIRLGLGDSVVSQPVGGDSDGWDVDGPIGANVVTVKPRRTAVNSNLILRAAGRSYVIALEVVPEHSTCKGQWQLSFQVPAPPVMLAVESPELVAAREARAVQDAAREAPPGRNWSYSMQAMPNSDDILPTEVFDDGRFTFIRIPGNRELPSVFRISPDGTESVVERHMEGRDLMVIHEVARQWVLRLDKQTVGLWNDAFDIEGVPPVAGARSERVRRVIRSEEHNYD